MTTLQITFVSESAGYRNTLGYYNKRTGEVEIIYLDTNDDGRKPGIEPGDVATIEVDQADLDAGNIGFFIIPNGADLYGTGNKSKLNGPLSFEIDKKGDGHIVDARGRDLKGEQGQVIFSDPALNRKNVDYTRGDDDADGILGRIAFEDLVKKSDRDFNDLVIDVQVVGENRPPVVEDQAFGIAENPDAGAPVGSIAASDPDGGDLTYEIVSGNESGAFAINAATGEITVADPSKFDFENPDLSSYQLTVKVTDAGGLSDTAVVGVAVGDVNEFAPVAADDVIAEAHEDVEQVIAVADLLANDSDGDGSATKAIVAVGDAEHGTVVLDGDVVRFTPDANYSGPASFSYTLSDGSFTDSGHVSLAIEAVADHPAIGTTNVSSTGDAAIPLSISVALADTDGSETLGVVTISGVPADWSLSAGVRDEETGNYTLTQAQLAGLSVTPAPGVVGSATLTISATATESSNGDAATAAATLTVSVDQSGAFQGHAIDGYITGATVFADTDADGVLDEGEASATTNAAGGFTLVGGSGPLVLSGGVDIATGQAFTGVLRAPAGSTVVTPLTTLVVAGLTPAQVSAAFGLDASIDLLNFDPIPAVLAGGPEANAAALVLAAGIQVQNTLAQAAALLTGAGEIDAGDAVLEALADAIATNGAVDLTDPAQAEALLLAAGASAAVAADAAQVIAATNAAVLDALGEGSPIAVLDALAQAASVGQGESLAQALAEAGATNDPGTLVNDYTGGNLDALIAAAPVGDVDGGLVGTLGDDVLVGGAGNDAIDGLSGNDLLDGAGGNDQLFGGPGQDSLRGGAGDDVLNGGVLADFQSFEGFTDTDRADYSGAAAGVNVDLATGIAQDGDGGTDTLIGIEAVTGSAFDDVLTGSGAFFEVFRGGAGNDAIDGAGGNDRADYADATAAISVSLGAPGFNMGTVTGDASVGTDTLIDIEQVIGSDFADTYVALAGFETSSQFGGVYTNFNSFEGRGGNDTITGNGNTRLDYYTASGAVSIDFTVGTAVGDTSVGTDIFTGVNQVRGTAYADTLIGGNASSNGFEGFDGRGGDDTIYGGSGFDRAEYAFNGPVSTGIDVDLAAGTVTGDPVFTGTDTLRGIESIRGTHLDDFFDATGFSPTSANAGGLGAFNEFEGMAGNDTVIGNGSTRVSYAFGREGVVVDLVAGIATGGASVGTDTLLGGISEVRGSNFDDVLVGTNHGTSFAQIYEGRGGDDTIVGGGGYDLARYSSDTAHTGIVVLMAAIDASTGTVTGDVAIGTDTLVNVPAVRGTVHDDFYDATGYNSAGSGIGTFNDFEGDLGNDTIIGNGNTRASFGSASSGVFVDLAAGVATGAGSGTDTLVNVFSLRGSNFADTLLGSAFNDAFEGRGGDDAIDGRLGFDIVRYETGATAGGSFVADSAGVFTATAGGHGSDSLQDIESIRGTNFADSFDASAASLGYALDGASGNDTIVGSQGDDSLFGGNGDDTLVGGAGWDYMDGGFGIDRADYSGSAGSVFVDLLFNTANDGLGGTDTLFGIEEVVGTGFNDTLYGDWANNVLVGGMGNDILRGGGGNDVLDGGIVADFQSDAGFRDTDRADYSTAFMGVVVDLAAGTAQDGDGGTDSLIGVEGVIGSAHDDNLTGGSDAFVEYFRGGAGNDTIDGGNWNDRAEYMDATGGITVNLAALAPNMGTVTGDASVGSDTLTNVEIVYGTDFADSYNAIGFMSAGQPGGLLSNFNAFEGRGGNDNIIGNGGTRIEYTGATAGISVDLTAGVASGDASVGTDTFSGVNSVRGSSFADTLLGGSSTVGTQVFDGRGGNDYIEGGLGFDVAAYAFDGPISTGITVSLAEGTVTGDPILTGTDTLRGIESLQGSHLDDWYDATGYSASSLNAGWFGTYNEFQGMAGNDTITGNGNTRILFGAAREGVSVDLAAGTAVGGASVGTDAILGGVWAVRGSNFNDLLLGSAASEYFEGRAGDDVIDGGGGFDTAAYDVGASGGGTFIANASGGMTATAAGLGADVLSGIESIIGTNFDDHFDGSAASIGYSVDGRSGNDTLIGSQGGDFLNGGIGDDTLSGGAGNDFVDGGAGNDVVDGGDGFDQTHYEFSASSSGSFVADSLGAIAASGGTGSDTLTNVEWITGTAFGDLFDASAATIGYSFDGYLGDDTLIGSQGSDFLLGGDGNDLLRGGLGADFLDGGTGADRFDFDHLDEAGDSIAGFDGAPGGDVLDVGELLANSTNYAGGTGGAATDYVRIEASGTDGLLQIDTDGAGGPATWQMLAFILGGGGLNAGTLLAQGNLDVGSVVIGDQILIGTPGNDVLVGGPGNDTLLADLGGDFLQGNGGNDVLDGYVIADLQTDIGFRDTDRVDYSTSPAGVTVNLGTGTASDGWGGIDSLNGIESASGSAFDDLLIGSNTTFSENFHGGAGNDTIQGGGGFDRAEYQDATAGVTFTVGGFGDSTATVSGDASVGFDSLADVEQFLGSDFADSYSAGFFSSGSLPGGFFTNFNAFEGRGGNDAITGNGGTRVDYVGATGAVTVNLATGIATGDASVGIDSILGGVNAVRASSHDDTLLGGNPAADGFEGFDGRGGNDFIDGGQGWDRAEYTFNGPVAIGITVNLAAGTVAGDPTYTGFDTLRGIEAIRGSHQNDSYDATGFSELSLNAGWSGTLNEFEGMAGNDTIVGNGNTRIVFGLAREGVLVNLETGMVFGGASVGTDTILGGVYNVRGTSFNDELMGSSSADILFGGFGDDVLRGGMGSDFLDGGAGSDRFDFDFPWDGTDTIANFLTGSGNDVIDLADLMINWTTYEGGLGGALQDFVRIDSLGFDGLLQVDPDGVTGPQGWQDLAILLGTGALNVTTLLIDGNLDVGPTGGSGGITLVGTSGNDFLPGTPGDDTISGLLGNDFLIGLGGNDLLDGGIIADLQSDDGFRDNDRIDYSQAPSGVNVNLRTSTAADGYGGTDTLIGIEAVTGSMFNDTIVGSNTTFSESFRGGAGDDFIDGGGGNDQSEYADATNAVSIFLGFGGAGSVSGDLSVGFDTLLGVERFQGSSFADTYDAGGFNGGFNSFEGRGGDDQIFGNWATRIEFTGATSGVVVDIDLGQATGDASVGTDTFSGVTQARGSSHADTFLGATFFSDETFDGRGGNDFMDGRLGTDRADYAFNGPVAFGISVDLAGGTVVGDPTFTGTDTLRSIEAIRGSHKDDLYDARGFSGASTNAGSFGTLNEFEGMAGNDTVWGNGNTRLTFGNAREGVSVDLAAGTVTGGASVGNDTLMGGVNQMRGSSFDDLFEGTNHGITFAEVYEGRAGNDTYSGRGGFDQARYDSDPTAAGITVVMAAIDADTGMVTGDAAIGTDTLTDIVGVVGTWFDDVYDGTGYFSAVSGLAAFNEFEGLGGNDHITGNGSTRVSYISSWDGVTVDLAAGTASSMGAGIDTLVNVFSVRGSNNADTLLGGFGADTFEGRGGDDSIDGGPGNDLVRYDNGSSGGGTFIANAMGGFTATAPGHGTDTLVNVEQIRGSNFADSFDGSARFLAFTFDGRGGNDTIVGTQDGDDLRGGDGNDWLRGGLGADMLRGEAGSDTFDYDLLAEGGDTLLDFQAGPGGDVIDIADLLAASTGYNGGLGGPLENFVRVDGTGPHSLLQVDADGGLPSWTTVATMLNVPGLNLATMIADGNLDTLI